MAVDRDNTDVDEDAEAEAAKPGKSGKLKWWLLGVAVVLLLIALAVGLTWFLLSKPDDPSAAVAEQGDASEVEQAAEPAADARNQRGAASGPPQYMSLEPALTVNFSEPSSSGRFLQVVVQVMARDAKVLEALDNNLPAARNDLILLLGEQDPVALRTREGKEALQQAVLDALRSVIEREAPGAGGLRERRAFAQGLEAVFFTKFVIQ